MNEILETKQEITNHDMVESRLSMAMAEIDADADGVSSHVEGTSPGAVQTARQSLESFEDTVSSERFMARMKETRDAYQVHRQRVEGVIEVAQDQLSNINLNIEACDAALVKGSPKPSQTKRKSKESTKQETTQ